MRIDRFAVRDFRKLAEGVAIEGLEPGITVIVGDNEEGKSTLLKALQSAFFDRHNLLGQAVEEMMPFGARGVRPSVEVDFELAGTNYRLEKTFGRDSAVSLRGRGERLQGEAAEEKLQALLGFSRPGRGAADKKHRGLTGLLWVEQGHAFEPLDMSQDTQAGLRKAIEGEVGQVLGGEHGRRLLDLVEKRTNDYFTKTGQEKAGKGAKLAKLRNRTEVLNEDCEKLAAQLGDYDEKVSKLERLNGTLERYDREGSIAIAKEDADRAKEALLELQEVEREAETAKERMEQAATDMETANDAKSRRTTLIKEADVASEQASKAKFALEKLEPNYLDARKALSEAEDQFNRCLETHKTANEAWEVAHRMHERAVLDSELQALGERLKRAESLEKQISQGRHALDADPIGEDAVAELNKLHSKQIAVNAALNAAAVAVTFLQERGQGVLLDKQPVDTTRPVRVTHPSTFQLEDFGKLDITPGERDISQLRTEMVELDEALQEKLRRLGQRDLASAESALNTKQTLHERVNIQEGELRGLVPEGLDALRNTVGERQARLSALVGQDADSALDAETARSIEQKALLDRREAESAVELARQDQGKAQKLYTKLRDQRVTTEAALTQSDEVAANSKAKLEDARRNTTDQELAKRTNQAEKKLEHRRTDHAAILAKLDAMNPEALRIELERADEAHNRLREQKSKTERDERDLRVELRTLGQQGLAEQLEEKRGELNVAQSDLARTEADAKAWKLLLETLREAEREAKEAFLGPVRDRLQPYLQMLFPETELRLGEDDLEIVSLRRGEVEERFNALSIGAREQVAVLTRLALADLLREKDKPVTLILDDPLVNSDDKRFRRMMLALRKAASSLQILILTCHEARYETLGAKMIRLADCQIED
ncbi:MAG: AAA family ATPase [Gammaproteobacteria bacterium]|nr:AAA family ATPase [Gammaproteobacteria bacterium]